MSGRQQDKTPDQAPALHSSDMCPALPGTLVVFFSSVMVEFYPSGVGPSRGINFAKERG